MRSLRSQNKSEPKKEAIVADQSFEKAIKAVEKKARKSVGIETPLESNKDMDLLNELKKLKIENKLLKNNESKLSKNEEKLLNAIRSEVLNQSTEEPVIGRSKFLKKLGMNSKYLDDSVKGLLDKKIIQRTAVKYSAKIMTNSWKILK